MHAGVPSTNPRTRVLALSSAILLLLSIALLPTQTPAYGAINDGLWWCNNDEVSWKFEGSSWNSTQQGYVQEAFDALETALDYDGSKLVNITKNSTPGVGRVQVGLVEFDDNKLGLALCDWQSPFVHLNIAYAGYGKKFFYQVARHEMLHHIGLDHVGENDSIDGRNPASLATCTGPGNFLTTPDLDRDSEVGLNWKLSSLSSNQVSANIGFENGTSEWGATNGSLATSPSSNFSGSYHAVFNASGDSSNSYVRQTVRLWTGDDSDVELRPYMRARSPLSGVSTNVQAALYRKGMTESNASSGCSYRRGLKNPNSVSLTSTYFLVSQSSLTSVGTSWTAVSGPWSTPARYDGYELQLRAYGNSAGDASVRFDNLRAEER